ncbi:hypothetical protein DENIS_4486 [Desulfonema ishimotonii]|uniref:Uncharacterized protein n=1 Tax=Desulfonema ishimotonii TaxID=45657 RepID=A0A401G2L3_9BACT|nr:hypothetical protein [Desulfonema ishimotonii]GBC63492.1 hypothetical protein DENIS_4486 [Desulfonema ishimotonii]
MGKYILYLLIAFIIAFAVDFFGVYDIPYIGSPVPDDASFYRKGQERMNDAARDALGEQ